MTVKRNPDGTWGVYRGPQGKIAIAGPFRTNAEAWRWMDRQTGESTSKAEDRSDWSFRQSAGGAGL